MDEKKLEEIREHMTQAFDLISTIPVMQNNVEIMASAKAHLQEAYALTNTLANDEKESSDG